MGFIMLPKWPFQRGFIDPADHERRGALTDLHLICDHNGTWSEGMSTWIPPHAALISERFLVHRWAWSRGKIIRLLNLALDIKLFWTRFETKNGRWLSPSDPHSDPHLDPQIGPLADPKNETQDWIYISRITSVSSLATEDPNTTSLSTILKGSLIIPPAHLAVPEVEEALEKFIQYRRVVLKKPIKSDGPLKVIYRDFANRTAAELIQAIHVAMDHEWVGVHAEAIHVNGHAKLHGGETPEDRARKIEEVRRQLALEGIIA